MRWMKITAILLVVVVCVQSVSLHAHGENNVTATNATDIAQDNTYASYIAPYASYVPATENVVVGSTAYEQNNGATIKEEKNFTDAAGEVITWTNENGSLLYGFEIPEEGLYQLEFKYYPLPGRNQSIEIGIKIDGQSYFPEMDSLSLPRLWRNNGEVRVDDSGNEFAPEQTEVFQWITWRVSDPNGLIKEPYAFALSKGRHTIELSSVTEPFALESISFEPPVVAASYTQMQQAYAQLNYRDAKDTVRVLEGEKADLKTSATMSPLSDPTSPDVQPTNPYSDKINYIGGTNWQEPGERLTWKIEVPQSGLYCIAFKYRQGYLLNANVYRRLLVDGEVPFKEAAEIAYKYNNDWTFTPLVCGEDAARIYLTEGEHEISLEVTLGPMADISERLEKTVYDIGKRYREMIMITGENPDANRDYNLFEQIPEMESALSEIQNTLSELADSMEKISQKAGGSNVATIRSMVACIGQMLKRPYYAQRYINDYYSNYCSVGSLLYNVKNMPLDIDKLVVYSPEQTFPKENANFFERLVFSFQRFIASFVTDYNSVSDSSKNSESITLWVNWGRDQVQVLNFLVKDSFEEQYGTQVNIRIVNASMIQAILSGKGPDCSLQLSRTQPVNLAMRGALCDLKGFEDFNEISERFMDTALNPYYLKGGCYALPDTQQFYMLFYRTDIFEELNLTVPKTWDEFINTLIVLERYNMQVGIPYTQISDMNQTDLGAGALNLFPTVLLQSGTAMYTESLKETNLLSTGSIQAFTFWTDLYTKYGLPVTYDFYNRFRTGQMPMAIASYTQYSTLSVAAPEISNCWSMAVLPGIEAEDGTINYSEAGSGTGAVILKTSQNKEAAWNFLNWWTSEETQYRYATGVEAILGVAARHPTSNVAAFKRLSWKKDGLTTLLDQWNYVQELPEVPGGYFVSRVIDQAFWSTVNDNENPKDTIMSWGKIANQEIQRKENEYYSE